MGIGYIQNKIDREVTINIFDVLKKSIINQDIKYRFIDATYVFFEVNNMTLNRISRHNRHLHYRYIHSWY